MKVSIIIVNYNVKYFLDQCLASIYASEVDFALEVIVVDNDSEDASVPYIREKYPQCRILENRENLGFSKANNQGIRICSGDYILLLNPDTILQKDSLSICVQFLDRHAESGAVGVRMIDGSGHFLPESKRGFPSPFVAFCKAFGISSLFPKSRIFNHYHLGHLEEDRTHEVEALSGAFMFIRREALDRAGLLDEQFFMYGEDIDLSYRIILAGFKIHYLADTTIIHFKGESTKKSSIRYYRHFYNAMILFAKKHFSSGSARIFQIMIRLAIYSKAVLSYLRSRLGGCRQQLTDLLIIMLVFLAVKYVWSAYYFGDPSYLPDSFYSINLPLYTICMVLGQYFAGSYHRPKGWLRVLRGGLYGLAAILLIYALLPASLRSSRMVILLGSALGVFILGLLGFRSRRQSDQTSGLRKILLAGDDHTVSKAINLLDKVDRDIQVVGFVHAASSQAESYLGDVGDIGPICRRFGIHEVIFCRDSYDMDTLIGFINRYGKRLSCKIFSDQTDSIIGSASKHSRGEIYTTDIRFPLADPLQRQWKRISGILMALLILIGFPLQFYLFKNPLRLLKNCLFVLANRLTWVGYIGRDPKLDDLPALPPCILPHQAVKPGLSGRQRHQLNFLYAKEYSVWSDLQVIFQYFRQLDGKTPVDDID